MTAPERIVLGIVGSPRHGGNTDLLVDEVLRGARDAGAMTTKLHLSDLSIHPCRACEACVRTGTCSQLDDMAFVAEQMRAADVWVLGTPVYLFGPTAQFKAFLDRWIGVPETSFHDKQAILVVPLAAPDPEIADHTLGVLQRSLQYRKMEYLASIVGPGLLDVGAVAAQPTLLAVAYEAGKRSACS